MAKKILAVLFLILTCLQFKGTYTTLPDNWPIEGEFTPVTLERMIGFKYVTMAYLGGIINYKPPVNPSVETWVENHTVLFRRYSISLEAKIFGFLNTFGGDEFAKGASMIQFISAVEALSMQELSDCQSSMITIEQEIQVLKSEIESVKSSKITSVQALVRAQLEEAIGNTPNPSIASIEEAIDSYAQTIASKELLVNHKNYCKNYAYEHGVSTTWATIICQAEMSLKTVEEQSLDDLIQANLANQKSLLAKLENVGAANDYLATDNIKELYSQEAIDTVSQAWANAQTSLQTALTNKRIEMDQGLLGGIYNPSDYTDIPTSSYVPRQVKYVSFRAFKTAWDGMNLPVASLEDLANWQLNFV